jgi:hypothetical protein
VDAAEANAQQAEAIRDGPGTAVDKLGHLITSLMASYSAHYPDPFVYIQEDLSKVADRRSAWARQMTMINKRYDDAVLGIVESGFQEGSIRQVGSARVRHPPQPRFLHAVLRLGQRAGRRVCQPD